MKQSNNKKSSSSQEGGGPSSAKSPKGPRQKNQGGPSCSREPVDDENPRNPKEAPRKGGQPMGAKNKGGGGGKGRKRKRNQDKVQVKLNTNYCYITSYFWYRPSSQYVVWRITIVYVSPLNLVCNEKGGFLTYHNSVHVLLNLVCNENGGLRDRR